MFWFVLITQSAVLSDHSWYILKILLEERLANRLISFSLPAEKVLTCYFSGPRMSYNRER